jgi:hypothetical protein
MKETTVLLFKVHLEQYKHTGCYKKSFTTLKDIHIHLYRGHIQCLNCHNVAKHSKFDARGTEVPNTTTVSAPTVEIKTATFIGAGVFWFEETTSATQVQRKFCTQYHKEPPNRPTIYSWHDNFVEPRCSAPCQVTR